MKLIEIYESALLESTIDQTTFKRIKKFCDDWNADRLYGTGRTYRLAQKYLDVIREWVNEHWGQDNDLGKMAEYLHGSLVGVIEWTTLNGRDTEKGRTMYNTKRRT